MNTLNDRPTNTSLLSSDCREIARGPARAEQDFWQALLLAECHVAHTRQPGGTFGRGHAAWQAEQVMDACALSAPVADADVFAAQFGYATAAELVTRLLADGGEWKQVYGAIAYVRGDERLRVLPRGYILKGAGRSMMGRHSA